MCLYQKVEGEMKVHKWILKAPGWSVDVPDVDVHGPDWHLKMLIKNAQG